MVGTLPRNSQMCQILIGNKKDKPLLFTVGPGVDYLKKMCISFLSSRYPHMLDEKMKVKECEYELYEITMPHIE